MASVGDVQGALARLQQVQAENAPMQKWSGTGSLAGIQQAREAVQRARAQALTRGARVRYFVRVAGIGETRLTGSRGIHFGTTFIDEPTFSYGLVATGSIPSYTIPQATAIVLTWKRNSKGMYIGADLGFQMDSDRTNLVVRFALTFEGHALRATPGAT